MQTTLKIDLCQAEFKNKSKACGEGGWNWLYTSCVQALRDSSELSFQRPFCWKRNKEWGFQMWFPNEARIGFWISTKMKVSPQKAWRNIIVKAFLQMLNLKIDLESAESCLTKNLHGSFPLFPWVILKCSLPLDPLSNCLNQRLKMFFFTNEELTLEENTVSNFRGIWASFILSIPKVSFVNFKLRITYPHKHTHAYTHKKTCLWS